MFHIKVSHRDEVHDSQDFVSIHDLLNYMNEQLAVWNNFKDSEPFKIEIHKTLAKNTLGVHVVETIKATDVVGRR